jgi:hypothetical protein
MEILAKHLRWQTIIFPKSCLKFFFINTIISHGINHYWIGLVFNTK